MKLALRTLSAVSLVAALVAPAMAQTVDFYFTQKGSTTSISSINLQQGAGSTVDLSVWTRVTGTFPFSAAGVMLKTDRTNTGTTVGQDFATPPSLLDNKVRVAGGVSGITNFNTAFGDKLSTFASTPNAAAPYDFGLDTQMFVLNGATTTATTAMRLFDVTIENVGLAAGQTYTISLLRRNATDDLYNTFLLDNNGTVLTRSATRNLTVSGVVPEPTSIALLGLGGLAFLRRRRARS